MKKNTIISCLTTIIVLWVGVSYAGDGRGMESCKNLKIPYCPSNNIEKVLADYTYFKNVNWSVYKTEDKPQTEGSLQTIFATCGYDCDKAGIEINAKRLIVNIVFEYYVDKDDNDISTGIVNFELVFVNYDSTLYILSLENGLLNKSDLSIFFQRMCMKLPLPLT